MNAAALILKIPLFAGEAPQEGGILSVFSDPAKFSTVRLFQPDAGVHGAATLRADVNPTRYMDGINALMSFFVQANP